MLDLVLSFIWAFMISVFAIPSIIYVSHLKNLLDEPNFRTVHVSLTPRLGGLAIFAGFMSALTIFGDVNFGIQRILAGCIVLFFIGLKDDIVSISAFKKFFIQILATGIVMFMGDIRLTSFHGFLNIYELEPGISYGLTFLIVVGVTNAINLIDGLDGLAGTIILIIASTFGIYFFIYGNATYQAYAALAFCLAGGMVGFLRYNMHKAIIFMGDTGSLVGGFLIAVLAIQFVEMNVVPSSPSIAIAVMAVPLFDTIRVFSIRILKGQSPFSPDKNHIHHILLASGLSQLQTVFVLAVANISLVAVVIYFSEIGNNMLLLGLFVTSLVAATALQLMSVKKNKRLVNQ